MSELLCLAACVGNYDVQVALPTSLRGDYDSKLLCLSACVGEYDVHVALPISLRGEL